MKKLNISPLKSIVFAVSVSALTLAGNAQAHSDFDYSIPAQLLILNTLLQPHYDRGHDHHFKHRGHKVRQGRHGHDRHRHGHGRGHYKTRKHSHSYGGYRAKSRMKDSRHH